MILIVDDDPNVRNFVKTALEASGYAVEEASGAVEALGVLQFARLQLLITDIVMPGTDGLKLAAQAHQLQPSLRVIFMTGFIDRYQDELTGSVCLSKPFTPAALLAAVESAIGLPRSQAGR